MISLKYQDGSLCSKCQEAEEYLEKKGIKIDEHIYITSDMETLIERFPLFIIDNEREEHSVVKLVRYIKGE